MLTIEEAIRSATKSVSTRTDLFELVGFALLVLLPAVLSSFGVSVPGAEHQALYSRLGFAKELLSSAQFGLVAVFLLCRHGYRTWGDIATKEISWPIQIMAGIGLWFAYYLFFDFWSALAGLFSIHSPSIAWLHPTSEQETALNTVFAAVNGLSEELMRVYLLIQLQRVGLRRNGAVVAAALAMTSYHAYQGAFTLIAFFIVHVVFNRFYLGRRAFLTLIVWHVLSDLMHSTDLLGWNFVSSMINGSVLIIFGGIRHWLGVHF